MNIFEILILGTILTVSLISIISYIKRPFKKGADPCENCPYSGTCEKNK